MSDKHFHFLGGRARSRSERAPVRWERRPWGQLRWKSALLALVAASPQALAQDDHGRTYVIRCGRIETGTGEVLERAAILVENGVIRGVGYDLEVPVGTPEIDARAWTVTPGFVHPSSELGQDRQRSAGNQAEQVAHTTFYPFEKGFRDALEEGFTTLCLPAARGRTSGLQGTSAIVQPTGGDGEAEEGATLVEKNVFFAMSFNTRTNEKDQLRKALEKVDEAIQKLDEAKAKWEEKQKKDKEKADKKKEEEKKEGEEKAEEKKAEEKKEEEGFKPPRVDDKTEALWGWVRGTYPALVTIGRAADYLHWTDLLSKRNLRSAFQVEGSDCYLVADRLGKAGATVLLDPDVTTYPLTAEKLNLPAFFERAGARVGFVPSRNLKDYRLAVAEVVRQGFPREKAVAAMTSVPSEAMGIAEHYGSIQEGRFADLAFFDGDPFEIGTEIRAVMVRGKMHRQNEETSR